jgi:hypothetical protein
MSMQEWWNEPEKLLWDPIDELKQWRDTWKSNLNDIKNPAEALVALQTMKGYMQTYRDLKSEYTTQPKKLTQLKSTVTDIGYFEFDHDILTPMNTLERLSWQLHVVSALDTTQKIALWLQFFNTTKDLQKVILDIQNDSSASKPFGYLPLFKQLQGQEWKVIAAAAIPQDLKDEFDTLTSVQDVIQEIKKWEWDLQTVVLDQVKQHTGEVGKQVINAAQQFLNPEKPKLTTYTKEGIQFSEMEIDRAQTLLWAQPEKLVQFLIEPLNLPDGIVKDTLVSTLRDIIWSPTGIYTRREVNSIVSKNYKKDTSLFQLQKSDKEIKITLHNGVDIKTATLSPVGWLANPWNALAVIPWASEAAATIDLLKTQIEQSDPNTKEQKSVSVRSGVWVQMNFPQWSHRLQVGGNLTIDPTFTGGDQFFQDGDILDQIKNIPAFGNRLSNILDTQLNRSPWKYIVLWLPVAKWIDIEYQLTFLPFKDKNLPLNLDKLQTSLTAQYTHLTWDWFKVNSGAIMFGVQWPLLKKKKKG